MTAFELYEAAFDSACDDAEPTTTYVTDYAFGAFDIAISDDVAKKIIACRAEFTEAGNGTNDYFYMIEKPLSAINI